MVLDMEEERDSEVLLMEEERESEVLLMEEESAHEGANFFGGKSVFKDSPRVVLGDSELARLATARRKMEGMLKVLLGSMEELLAFCNRGSAFIKFLVVR